MIPGIEIAKKNDRDLELDKYVITLKHLIKYLNTSFEDVEYLDMNTQDGEP